MSNEKVQLLFKLTKGKMMLAGIFPETHFTEEEQVPDDSMLILVPVGVHFPDGLRQLVDFRVASMANSPHLPDFSYIPENLYKENV